MRNNVINWTNKSVLSFSESGDPIQHIVSHTRDIIAHAIDKGWAGPPFDPVQLAEILNIETIASDDVIDARTISSNDNKPIIEFNPNRPKNRINFTVAHEIAHTFFPDWSHQIRHRHDNKWYKDDEWQLETLCNMGAAEILMPISIINDIDLNYMGIDQLIEVSKKLEVSIEALLIRVVQSIDGDFSVFVVSRNRDSENNDSLKVDYIILANSWSLDRDLNVSLKDNDLIEECTAVGYTAKGNLKFENKSLVRNIECVAIPSYVGHRHPRVAGIISKKGVKYKDRGGIKEIVGNALEPRGKGCKIIAHVINDKTPNWGGRGFANSVKVKWPYVQIDFREAVMQDKTKLNLGNVHECEVDNNIRIFHMVAQKGYGPSKSPRIRYESLRSCLKYVAEKAKEYNATIHMPMIGSGYGGGDWGITKEIIKQSCSDLGIEVFIYKLPGHKKDVNSEQNHNLSLEF